MLLMGEPGQTRAYHVWRMVWQRLVNCKTFKEVAASLFVAKATVWQVIDRFQHTEDVSASMASPRGLIEHICENPSIYSCKIQAQLLQTTGTSASPATLYPTLKHLEFTRKKVKHVEYQVKITRFDQNVLVFIGCDARNARRRFGYSLCGFLAQVPLQR